MATYTVTITDADETALNNDLLDIDTWIQGAVTGKINNCKKRMVAQWQPILFADESIESIPATADGIIALVVARDDYKTRAERDAESTP
jgi:hypothetical protein|tara:strand:- start:39 stop:305 length:267 start_codon:yes stop_codon:yes gene_type:complete